MSRIDFIDGAFVPLLVVCLLGFGCRRANEAGVSIEVDVGSVPESAREALAQLRGVYDDWFGVAPAGLSIELVCDEARRPDYDHFDQLRNTIRMGWNRADERAGRLTLAHELAHAYEWTLAPAAYEQEPSWIHEGLAEYGVWIYLRSLDRSQADAYLIDAARTHVTVGRPFEELFADVYAQPFGVAYPTCLLAVHVLAAKSRGREGLLNYFRTHGGDFPEQALQAAFGLDPAQLEQEVLALARRLLEVR